jgi:hypothetical protein
MFIRKTKLRGGTYYAVVEGHRDEFGRVRQEMVVSLGKSATISEAIRAAQAQIKADEALLNRLAQEFKDHPSEVILSFFLASDTDEDLSGGIPKWAREKRRTLRARIDHNRERLKTLDKVRPHFADEQK